MKRRLDTALKVPISTLIDVVFLLTIFFILTATLKDETLDVKVDLAETQYVEPVTPDLKLTVNIRRDDATKQVLVTSGGSPLNWDKVKSQAARFRMTYKKQVPVIIRVDRDMEYGEVDKVCKRLAKIGLYRVRHSTKSRYEQ